MKRIVALILLLTGLGIIDLLGQAEVLIEHSLPPGWRFHAFDVSKTGVKALYFLPDLPALVRLTEPYPTRLQVFDPENRLITDLTIEDGYSFDKLTSRNDIILVRGDESGCYKIRVLDLLGKELYTIDADGRWPREALLGGEIALVPGPATVGPVSIIDISTGRAKVIFDPPILNNKPLEFGTFIPIGEDGLYVEGIGTTIFLKSYLHEGKEFWRIQNIGGNIEKSVYLNDRLIAINFTADDFSEKKFMSGIAILEWRTGKILFEKKAYQIKGVQDRLYSRLGALNIFLDNEDSLFIYGGPEDILRLPKLNDMKGGWDEGISKKSRLIPRQLGRIKLRDKVMTPEVVRVRKGIYIIKDFGDMIRIEKAKYEDIQ